MPRPPRIVLADDLTGAAEVAAVAHAAGWRAMVLTRALPCPLETDVLVLDLNTRLARASSAARIAGNGLKKLAPYAPAAEVFCKFDSVLRGPVLAQLAAATRAAGRSRALLVPANPSLGRVLHQGRLSIAGRPLHETNFARDPSHPRTSSDVLALLGRSRRLRVAVVTPATDVSSATGILVGEAASATEVEHWASTLTPDTLPAGAADFFRAWLGRNPAHLVRADAPHLAAPALLLHGTTANPAPTGAHRLTPDAAANLVAIADQLRLRQGATLAAPAVHTDSADAAANVRTGFARAVAALHRQHAFKHLLVAGGATAAAALSGLGWHQLDVLHVWAPGVVSLRPLAAPDHTLTLKPGSYPWPDQLRQALPLSLF